MIRRSPIKRSVKPIARKAKVKARNPKRQRDNFARVYGSRERVAWVSSMPCVVAHCYNGPCHGHHVRSDGMGRKAHHSAIVPLCAFHHDAYHALGPDTFLSRHPLVRGESFAVHAADTHRRWLAHLDAEKGS